MQLYFCRNAALSLNPLCGDGDLLFLLRPPPPPHFVSALTLKPLLQIFAVCTLALGNLPGIFFSVSLLKSRMAAKILCRSLELEPLHGFASCLV